MSEAVLPAPGPADVQPVAHETLDRIATGLVTAVPMLALGFAAWQSWQGLLKPADLVIFAVFYVLTGLGVTVGFHRLFTHRSFKTKPAVRGDAGDPRLDRDRGPGDLVGRRPSQAPCLLRQARAIRTARTSITAAACAARCAASCTRTSAGCSCTTSAARASGTRPTCSRDPVVASSTVRSCSGRVGGLVLPFRLGFADRRQPRRRADRPAVGRARAAVRAAPPDLQHQLGLPRLRPPALRDRRRVAQRLLARAADVRRGLAQQPPRLPDVRAARAADAGSSTRPRWSSAASRRRALPGTWCGSARNASPGQADLT